MKAGVIASVLATLATVQASCKNPQTHNFDWTVGWKTVNPDGKADRDVVAINGEWPLPVVRVEMCDRIVATVTNNLTNPYRNSSIHWHGMFQNGTTHMDGPTWLSQCPTAPNLTFTYNFTVDQPGTYWYHAHVDGLYPDGYRQMLLVDEDDAWFEDDVDDEIFFSFSDWYHELTQILEDTVFLSLYNPTGAEPVPDSILFNDTVDPLKIKVEPSKTYRLRIANIGAFSGFYFYIPGHNFTIVEVDGVYTEPADAQSIYLGAAQRYSILFNTTSNPDEVYQMVQMADQSLYDIITPAFQLNNTAFMYQGSPSDDQFVAINNTDIYNSGLVNTTDVAEKDMTTDDIAWFDDMDLVPYDGMPLLPDPDVNVTLHLEMLNLLNGVNYAMLNSITYTHPKVPALYSVISAPDDDTAANATVYGTDTHPLVLEHNQIVQVVLNNDDSGKHPFHLHGHNFQCLLRAPDYGDLPAYVPYNASDPDNTPFPDVPIRRDTFVVMPQSHFVVRFRADNPGVWFFHCHIDWHLSQGLALVFIEAPAQIRQNYKIHPLPQDHIDGCKGSNLPWVGNAAANTQNFYNLTGQNVQQKNLPPGFTARGIVALVFSIICAFVGMGFLVWYGLSDTTQGEEHLAETMLNEHIPEDDISNHEVSYHPHHHEPTTNDSEEVPYKPTAEASDVHSVSGEPSSSGHY